MEMAASPGLATMHPGPALEMFTTNLWLPGVNDKMMLVYLWVGGKCVVCGRGGGEQVREGCL